MERRHNCGQKRQMQKVSSGSWGGMEGVLEYVSATCGIEDKRREDQEQCGFHPILLYNTSPPLGIGFNFLSTHSVLLLRLLHRVQRKLRTF